MTYHYLTTDQVDVNTSAWYGDVLSHWADSSTNPTTTTLSNNSPNMATGQEYSAGWTHSSKTISNIYSYSSSGLVVQMPSISSGSLVFTVNKTQLGKATLTVNLEFTDGTREEHAFCFYGKGTFYTQDLDLNGGSWYATLTSTTFKVPADTTVKLPGRWLVTPPSGYTFVGWNTSADGSGTSVSAASSSYLKTDAVTISSANTWYAQYKASRTINFAHTTGGNVKDYSGLLNVTSITVADGYTWYASGSYIYVLDDNGSSFGTYRAIASSSSYAFSYWTPSSGTVSGSDVTITAVFAQQITVTINSDGHGSVSRSSVSVGSGTTFSSSSSGITFSDGQSVTFSPYTGYEYNYVSPSSGTITSASTITVYFKARYYSVTMAVSPSGSGTWSSQPVLEYGTSYSVSGNTVTFTKNGTMVATSMFTVSQYYQLSSISPSSGTVTSSTTITASLTKIPLTALAVSPSSSSLGRGGNVTLTAIVTPQTADPDCTWSAPSGVTLSSSEGSSVTVTAGNTSGTFTITATSKTTPSLSATATVTVTSNYYFVVWFDGNGGTASSTSIGRTVSSTSCTISLGGNNAERDGYTFVNWNTSADGSGDTYTPDDSVILAVPDQSLLLYAIWSADTPMPGYNLDASPKASVRIYRNPMSYVDMTLKMTVQPSVHRSVNRAGSFSFAVTNDPADSFLSATYDGWSDDYVGAIDWGMYCIVQDIDTRELMSDGYIATMELNEYTLSIECADHLAILGSAGADIHRNYYDSRTANVLRGVIRKQYDAEAPDSIKVDITDIIEAGGSVDVSTAKYRTLSVDTSFDNNNDTRLILRSGTNISTVTWTGNIPSPYSGITFRMWKGAGLPYKGTITINGTAFPFSYSDSTSSGAFDLHIDLGTMFEAGECVISLTSNTYGVSSGTLSVYANTGTSDGTIVHSGGASYSGHIQMVIDEYEEKAITATTSTSDGSTYLNVTGVTDYNVQSDYEMLTIPSDGRVKFSYLSGTVSASEIIRNVSARSGYTPNIITSAISGGEPELMLFRSGGGYSLDYLQKVADLDHAMTFTASGIAPTLHCGARRTSSNAPSYSVTYGNGERSGSELVMYSFIPRKTMKNRPSRAMIRTVISSKGSDSRPVLALVYNARTSESRQKVDTDTIVSSSSVLTVYDAVRAVYSAVYVDEEDWEGTLALSGIIPGMIDNTGTYAGSGKVISVTDPRYGFDAKSFVITDVVYDYETITTKLTLSNAPQVYSSTLNNTVATAYTTADLVVGDSESTAYNTQYVYIRAENVTITTANAVKLVTSTGEYSMGDISAYVMNGHTLVYAAYTFTSEDESSSKYDGRAVILNGMTIPISESARPDCYEGQTVIVNIDVTT